MYVSLHLLTKCSKHRSWNRYTKHRSWNWCENVAEQIIGRLSQGEKIAKTKMSDWFLVRFLSNIWKKNNFESLSSLINSAPIAVVVHLGPRCHPNNTPVLVPSCVSRNSRNKSGSICITLQLRELTNSRQGFFSMQEHPKRKMHCSGEDDKALDLRVPCFQTNPSADEVGLPFHQKIP